MNTTTTGSVLTSINRSNQQHFKINNTIQKFVSCSQFQALSDACRGEEGQFFEDMLASFAQLIDTMPVTYQQDGKGDDALV